MEIQMNKNFTKREEDKDVFNYILNYIEPNLANILFKISNQEKEKIEEIRVRLGKPLMICMKGKDFFVSRSGNIFDYDIDSYLVTEENLNRTFQLLSNYSVYALEEELKNGFITIKGGHRVGIVGKTVYGKNGLETIKDISSLNIRIGREKIGVSNKLLKYLINKNNTIHNTLIVSPPQCGKTTLLRDIVRNLSNGVPELDFRGVKIGVVDERSEIAGIYKGRPQKNLGVRTDILDGCLKYDGIILLIRSMSPNIIATDELGHEKDVKAIHEALKAGIKLIATVHGDDISDIKTKPNLRSIIEEKIFKRIIVLDNSKGVGTLKDVIDGDTFKTTDDYRGE